MKKIITLLLLSIAIFNSTFSVIRKYDAQIDYNGLYEILDINYEMLRDPYHACAKDIYEDFFFGDEFRILVYEQNSRVVGFITYEKRPHFFYKEDQDKGIGVILHLAIHPDYQDKGIGTKLVNHVNELLKELKCHSSCVYTNCGKNEKFYTRFRFEKLSILNKEHPVIKPLYRDKYDDYFDAYFMTL